MTTNLTKIQKYFKNVDALFASKGKEMKKKELQTITETAIVTVE